MRVYNELLPNKVGAANAGWRSQFRFRGPPFLVRLGSAVFAYPRQPSWHPPALKRLNQGWQQGQLG